MKNTNTYGQGGRLVIDNRFVIAATPKEGLGSSCKVVRHGKGRKAKGNPEVGSFRIISIGGRPV